MFEAVAGKELEIYGYPLAAPDARVSTVEKNYITFILHPMLRIKSMAKNLQGLRDELVQMVVYFRLRLHYIFNSR